MVLAVRTVTRSGVLTAVAIVAMVVLCWLLVQ